MPHFPQYRPPPPPPPRYHPPQPAYRPPYRPHYSPPPPPPPPPPVPQAVLEESMCTGSPRCYFCGKLIEREEDVRKTEYHVGHGQKMLVMICPACVALKARGAGSFEPGGAAVAAVAAVVLVIAFALFMVFVVLRPAFDDAPARPVPERNRPVQTR